MPKKILILALLALFTQICTAQEDNNATEPQHDFPYKAQIVGENVYVRSGPAIQYYFTSQLNQPQVVTVVGNVYSWYKIIPPKDSFSWVTKEEVLIDTENPGTGIITGDNVRIWAGKPALAPEDSTSLQVKLNKGDKVQLLGEESGDYYKIAPPEGAHLWINGEYLKYLAQAEMPKQTAPVEEKPAEQKPVKPDTNTPADTNQATEQTAEVNQVSVITREPNKPSKTEYEINKTKDVYEIIKQINEERQKAISKQNYDGFKQSLTEIAEDEKAKTAARYARYQLERINGYELAIMAEKELNQSDQQLEQLRKKIDAWRQDQLKKLKITDDYITTGMLKKSLVFADKAGTQRYMIVDGNGKIICYAVAVGESAFKDLSEYVGKEVGLKGDVVADPASGIGLVKFEEIELLKK